MLSVRLQRPIYGSSRAVCSLSLVTLNHDACKTVETTRLKLPNCTGTPAANALEAHDQAVWRFSFDPLWYRLPLWVQRLLSPDQCSNACKVVI